MSPLIRRGRADREPEPDATSGTLAALINSVESSAAAMREDLSQHELRELAREQARSQGRAWEPIRGAARKTNKR
jgi:hypothetical protein